MFHKRLLPTYDVFDEGRYFESRHARRSGSSSSGMRFGLTICEDAWNAVESPLREVYDDRSGRRGRRVPAPTCCSISALRRSICASAPSAPRCSPAIARQHRRPFAFVNLVGGNDDLLFDGSSALYGADGACWRAAPSFEEDVLVCDLARPARPARGLARDRCRAPRSTRW